DWVVMHTKQAAYRTYVIGARIPKASVKRALYWDEPRSYHQLRGLPEAYHYVRVSPLENEDLLFVGGEDHKTGQADDSALRYQRLESWARERFHMIQAIAFQWSGQGIEPVDGLAVLGT